MKTHLMLAAIFASFAIPGSAIWLLPAAANLIVGGLYAIHNPDHDEEPVECEPRGFRKMRKVSAK